MVSEDVTLILVRHYDTIVMVEYTVSLIGPEGYVTIEQPTPKDAALCAESLIEATNDHHTVKITPDA